MARKHGRWGKYISHLKTGNSSRQVSSLKGDGKRQKKVELDGTHLEEIWQEQRGRCAVTGVPLELRYQGHEIKDRLLSASIDRLDNSIEYVNGNVQFVALGVVLTMQKMNFPKNRL